MKLFRRGRSEHVRNGVLAQRSQLLLGAFGERRVVKPPGRLFFEVLLRWMVGEVLLQLLCLPV